MTYSIDELLQRISITEMAEHLGYVFQPKKGKKVPIYRNENGDKIGIFNPHEPYAQRYFNLQDPSDKGGLFSFIRNRLQNGIIANPFSSSVKEWMSVKAVMLNYLHLPLEVREKCRTQNAVFRKEAESSPNVVKDFSSMVTEGLEHREFLYSRGFSYSVLKSPLFEGRILNLKGKPYTCTFPLYRFDKVEREGGPHAVLPERLCGMEARNRSFKNCMAGSDKSHGIWHSNVPDVIRSVFVAESPLDCIAHRQLRGSDNTLYISFGGMLCKGQLDTLCMLLDVNRSRIDRSCFRFLLGTDNDRAGFSYDFTILKRQLAMQGMVMESRVNFGSEDYRLELMFPNEDLYHKVKSLRTLMKSEECASLGVKLELADDVRILFVDFPNNSVNAFRFVLDSILKTDILPFTRLEKSEHKDWNEDLQAENNRKRMKKGLKL